MKAESGNKTRRSFLCPTVLVLVSLCLLPSSFCPGATLQTLDAKTYQGEI
jgi:hypothetical protein